jgi:hypothetical protein
MKKNWTFKWQPVVQYDLGGKFVREYASIKEAAQILDIDIRSIFNCLRGKLKSTNRSQWRLKKEVVKDGKIMDIEPVKTIPPDYFRGVRQFNKKWEFIRDYPSILEAADKVFTDKHSILRCANRKMESAAGYRWRFLEEVVKDGEIIDSEPVKPVKDTSLNYLQAVCQFGLDGKFIRDYPSIHEAANKIHANKHNILRCANKKMRSTVGYQWRFLEEVVKDVKIMDIEPVKTVKNTSLNYIHAVCQFGPDGKFIREFPSILDAAVITMTYKLHILSCANKKRVQYAGYQWRFKKEVVKDGKIIDIEPIKTIPPDYFRGVCQFDKDGKFIREYPSIVDAANKTYADKYYILRCANKKMRSTAGYQWRFKDE